MAGGSWRDLEGLGGLGGSWGSWKDLEGLRGLGRSWRVLQGLEGTEVGCWEARKTLEVGS